MAEKQLKHLEMIQGVINRMSQISFLLKGWTVVMVSALFALSAKEDNWHIAFLTYFPVIMFWILDAYFLMQEKLFRKLYDKVRLSQEDEIDFSMDTTSIQKIHKVSFVKVFFSKTLLLFHGVIVATITVVINI